ncbi:hypothetical protein ACOSP7_025455 [Xanthoceras sorbifolium]
MHWCSWDSLCRNKLSGGLGFRYLFDFNQSLLAKQGWRLLIYPNSLAARVMKGMYFPNSDFLQAKDKSQSSFIWKSFLWGCTLLEKGLRWGVRGGKNIRIYHDRWIPPSLFFLHPISEEAPRPVCCC